MNIKFKRGSTFNVLLQMPDSIPKGYFANWVVKAQLRKENVSNTNGLIANLATTWYDTTDTKILSIQHHVTDDWPLTTAELDVKFTSPEGTHVYSDTIKIVIVASVTQ